MRFVVSSLFCRLGFVAFVVGLGFRTAPHLSWLRIWDARGCVRAPPTPRRFRFRCAVWACVLGSRFRLRPATPWGGVGVCVCSCARPAWFRAPPGWGCCAGVRVCARALLVPRLFWLGCAVWACVLGLGLGCAPLFLVGLSGCVCFFFCVFCFGFVVLVAGCACPGPCGPCPPIPSLSGWVAGSFFFSSQRGVCLRVLGVPSPGGPLLLVWCCRLWLGGPPVPLWGSCLRCLPGGGFGRPLWCWRAVWWLWAFLSPPPLPPCFFLGGGLPVPPSAFPGLAHALARILCGLPGCCWRLRSAWPCPGPMGQVGYVHVGLGAPSCRVRSWLCRLGSCARGLRVALG